MISAKAWVFADGSSHFNCGEMSGPSQVDSFGIASPAEKAVLEIWRGMVAPFSWAKIFSEGHGEKRRAKPMRTATLMRADISRTLLRSSMTAQKFGDFGMAAFLRESKSRLSIVRLGQQIGAAGQQDAHDSQMAIRGGGKKRGEAVSVTVIRVRAIGQEPRHDGGVAAGYGSGQRVVSRSICRCRVDLRALRKQVLGNFKVAKHGRHREHRKPIERVRLGLSRHSFNELFYALQPPQRRGFVQLKRNSASQQDIAEFLVAAVRGQQQSRLSLFVAGACQFWLGRQHSFGGSGVPRLNDLKKLGDAAHLSGGW